MSQHYNFSILFYIIMGFCFQGSISAQTNNTSQPSVIQASEFPITISGKVTDKITGEPLLGVSIIALGTTKGATTNYDGEFEIYLEDPITTLQFNYLGFKQEDVIIKNDDFLDVQLTSDINALDAVVVTALAIKKSEERIGYATQSVNGQDLVKTQEPNIVAILPIFLPTKV